MLVEPVKNVLILGGGSAGFIAAIALKGKLPDLRVSVVRSKDIGIIGVGEGSTVTLTNFLHKYIGVGRKKFFEVAQPTWKLGLKFIWGPRPHFFYTFDAGPDARPPGLPKAAAGFYYATVFDPVDQFKAAGYTALLAGQCVPYRKTYTPGERELKQWNAVRQRHRELAQKAMSVREALAAIRAPGWKWPA